MSSHKRPTMMPKLDPKARPFKPPSATKTETPATNAVKRPHPASKNKPFKRHAPSHKKGHVPSPLPLTNEMFRTTLRPLFVDGAGFTNDNFNNFFNEHIEKYRHFVFIHNSAIIVKTNKHFNYEYWEIMGDAILNHLAVQWISDKFPQYHTAEGVQVIAQLKIKIISTNSWSDFAIKNNFHTIIDCDPMVFLNMPKNVLEDVFEAFFGYTEHALGYDVCRRIFYHMLQDFNPSTSFDDLFDPIQRLQQLKDKFKFKIRERVVPMGTKKTCYIYFTETKEERRVYGHAMQKQKHTIYYIDNNNQEILIGNGDAEKITDARRIACIQAIACLQELGYALDTPEVYK